jgi:xanthine dehydrogenase accessory factor
MRDLLAELTNALSRRLPCVYCAVVETRGSTPQKAGAAMLVYLNGAQAGTLGGGCVEAEVKRRALCALNDAGQSEVLTFCLDEDYGWDDGLICGGRMTILAHPLTALVPTVANAPGSPTSGALAPGSPSGRGSLALPQAEGYYGRLRDLVDRGDGFTEAVVIGEAAGLPIGDRYLFAGTGDRVSCLATRPAWETVAAHLPPLTIHAQPVTRQGIAYLPIPPRVTVFLIGGGHVGQAVGRLASEVGFDVEVLDDREQFASAERFSTARRRLVGDIGATLRELAPTLGPTTFAVILTRGHRHDEEALYHLAGTACGYVGMIGSKRKIRMIFEDLVAKGVPAEALARVHAPLGYNIGSQTVPEIAVSIVAELIACRNSGHAQRSQESWARK